MIDNSPILRLAYILGEMFQKVYANVLLNIFHTQIFFQELGIQGKNDQCLNEKLSMPRTHLISEASILPRDNNKR